MIRYFLTNNPRKLVVTKETDKELRASGAYKNFELVNTFKNNRGVHAFTRKLMSQYNIAFEDVDVRFFMFWGCKVGIDYSTKSPEWFAQDKITRSNARKGKKYSAEHRAAIGRGQPKKKNWTEENRQKLRENTIRNFHRKLKELGPLKWIYDPYTGDTSRIPLNKQPPEGWLYGRPNIQEYISSTKAPGKKTRMVINTN